MEGSEWWDPSKVAIVPDVGMYTVILAYQQRLGDLYEYTQVVCNTHTQITIIVIGNGNRSYHNKYAIGTAKPPSTLWKHDLNHRVTGTLPRYGH